MFTARITPPMLGNKAAHALTFVCIGGKTVAVASSRRALAHIFTACLEIVFGIQAAAAIIENIRFAQRLAKLTATF